MTDPALKTLNRLFEIAKDFESSDEDIFWLPGIWIRREFPAPLPPPRMGRKPGTGETIVIPPSKKPHYPWCPKNSTEFANTGGDGNHLRFLHIDGATREESPIIMTVPTNYPSERNFIVGENLLDFLALGCRSIYDLEGLAWDRSKMIEFLEHPEKGLPYDNGGYQINPILEPSPEQKILIEEFNLKPWENVEERLDYLREKYLHLLVVEEE